MDIQSQIDYLRNGGPLHHQHGNGLAHCKGLADTMQLMLAVCVGVTPMIDEIQKQLEQNAGWHQFEFFTPEIDMHWFIKTQKALAALEKSSDVSHKG